LGNHRKNRKTEGKTTKKNVAPNIANSPSHAALISMDHNLRKKKKDETLKVYPTPKKRNTHPPSSKYPTVSKLNVLGKCEA